MPSRIKINPFKIALLVSGALGLLGAIYVSTNNYLVSPKQKEQKSVLKEPKIKQHEISGTK